ncbi:MAG: GRAS family protein [Nannocystaceae bacterium]|nr:GRAS family protein [bacterium]
MNGLIDAASARSFEDLRTWIDAHDRPFVDTPRFADFFAGLTPIESSRVGALWDAVVDHDDGSPRVGAEALVRGLPDTDDEDGALTLRTFAEALMARGSETDAGGGNLYLAARPPGAQLRAFELLRLRTPLIPFAYAAANRAILDAVGKTPQPVTLVDVGIGRGGQVRALLRNPQSRQRISKLHVIGIEPDSSSATGAGALQTAEATVLETARDVGIPTTFTPLSKRAEEITPDDFASAQGQVIGNAAFALHHVDYAGAGGLDRSAVLRTLRKGGVETMVLVEPDSNHFIDDLAVRFLFAYRHYRAVAMSLRAMLMPADAQLVWTEFFAPEVHNVIAHENSARTERHEPSASWARRLSGAGFAVEDLGQLVTRAGTPPGFSLDERPDAFSLCFQGVALLSVLRGRG